MKYSLKYDKDIEYDENEAKMLADFYVYLSLKFIFLHEVGHVMNGHLAYLQTVNMKENEFNLKMNLNEEENINGISTLQYQMLELDADSFAATNIVTGLIGSSKMDNTYIDRFKPFIKTKHHFVLIPITSNIISLSLQGLGAKRKQIGLSESKYIPMRMRLKQILGVYIKYHRKIIDVNNKDIISIDDAEILELIKVYERYTNQYLVEIGYYDENIISEENNLGELNEEVHSHTEILYSDIWPKLREKLKLFAIGELA